MPSLRELKKHLKSIQMTGQLAGAMKTVSAAKFSRINAALDEYTRYEAVCRAMTEKFGFSLSAAYPCQNPDAPRCYVILGSNRGLCGGYNAELLNFCDGVLAKANREYTLIVSGKTAISHYHDRHMPIHREFVLPDAAAYEDCIPLLDCIMDLYRNGEVSSVTILYQKFVNMLTQKPTAYPLLPLAGAYTKTSREDILYVPDRETVLRSAARTCVNSAVYTHILEAGAGAQAATLMAMRSAYDNAEQSSAELESAISRKRQSEVTSSVIETSGGIRES